MQIEAVDPNEEVLAYAAEGLPDDLSIDDASGMITGTISFTAAGNHEVTVTVSDGVASDSVSFDWRVANLNRPPDVQTLGPQTGQAEFLVSLPVQATDADERLG